MIYSCQSNKGNTVLVIFHVVYFLTSNMQCIQFVFGLLVSTLVIIVSGNVCMYSLL